MTVHPGFLANILEHPEDDNLRLIYADWLEDHGDPEHAELIRLQILQRDVSTCRVSELIGLIADREFNQPKSALARLNPIAANPYVVFERGFISCVGGNFYMLRRVLPTLLKQYPINRVMTSKNPLTRIEGITQRLLSGAYWYSVPTNPRFHRRHTSVLPSDVWILLEGQLLPPEPLATSVGTLIIHTKRHASISGAEHQLSEALIKEARAKLVKKRK